MTISLIAAVARNGVIGREGRLPWRLPDDLARFRDLTIGHHVLMGRRTHESIGRPLPGRTNLVLSRDPAYAAPGCRLARSIDEALGEAREAGETEIFVIGGASVYRSTLPIASRLYLTRVEADVPGDVRFPEIDPRQWREVEREDHPADERHEHPFAFTVLARA